MDSIFHRTSIRRYRDKEVEPEKIDLLLRAGFAAPSAKNQQPWEFYVVTKKEALKKLSECSPYAGWVKDAPLAIVPCYREDCLLPNYAEIDLSIASENILIEADTLGLGAVWLGIAPVEERQKAVEEAISIQKGLRAFAILSIGYPAEERKQQDRYDSSRIHYVH